MELPMSSAGEKRQISGQLARVSLVAISVLTFVMAAREAEGASRTRLWNLTTGTIKEFRLAPAGSASFGKNQCENDPDAAVDHDERLDVTGISSGKYDAKIVYASGKACIAHGIEIREGKVFSIDDHDLVDCK
jgi:hypothetical protein